MNETLRNCTCSCHKPGIGSNGDCCDCHLNRPDFYGKPPESLTESIQSLTKAINDLSKLIIRLEGKNSV